MKLTTQCYLVLQLDIKSQSKNIHFLYSYAPVYTNFHTSPGTEASVRV